MAFFFEVISDKFSCWIFHCKSIWLHVRFHGWHYIFVICHNFWVFKKFVTLLQNFFESHLLSIFIWVSNGSSSRRLFIIHYEYFVVYWMAVSFSISQILINKCPYIMVFSRWYLSNYWHYSSIVDTFNQIFKYFVFIFVLSAKNALLR